MNKSFFLVKMDNARVDKLWYNSIIKYFIQELIRIKPSELLQSKSQQYADFCDYVFDRFSPISNKPLLDSLEDSHICNIFKMFTDKLLKAEEFALKKQLTDSPDFEILNSVISVLKNEHDDDDLHNY